MGFAADWCHELLQVVTRGWVVPLGHSVHKFITSGYLLPIQAPTQPHAAPAARGYWT